MGEKTKNIVVIGAGFGGLLAALKLDKKFAAHSEYRVILIDKNSYQTYTPSLYEVATAYRGGKLHKGDEEEFAQEVAGSVSFPVQDIIKGTGITFLQDKVVSVNPEVKAVVTASNDSVSYEYLVVAAGARPAYYDVEGAKTCCSSFAGLGDALRIRRQVEALFEKVTQEDQQLTIMAIGAGLSGFEVITEMAKYADHLCDSVFGFPRDKVNFKIVDASSKILSSVPAPMRKKAEKRLEALGIEVMINARIVEIEPHVVKLENGEQHEADLIIWSGGVAGSYLLENISGARLHASGRVYVDNYLRAEGTKDIFVVGDSAFFEDPKTGNAVPSTAWAAEQMAPVAAENIYRSAFNKPFVKYNPKYPGFIAAAGGKYAIAHLYGITVSGLLAWVLKRIVDLKYMVSIYPLHKGIATWAKTINLFTRND